MFEKEELHYKLVSLPDQLTNYNYVFYKFPKISMHDSTVQLLTEIPGIKLLRIIGFQKNASQTMHA